MKVFYIDPQSYNNLSLYDLSLLRHVKGHELTYYYSDLYQLEKLPDARCKCLFHYSHKKRGLMKAMSYSCSILRIFVDVLVYRPDVVHVQWIRIWHVDYLFAKVIQLMGIKVIHTAHNLLPHLQHRKDDVHYPMYYRLVDSVIVHNEKTRQDMNLQMGIPLDKIHVIRHGVLQIGINDEVVKQRAQVLREQFAIGIETILFSCLGVQKSYKGTTDIIQAWMECLLKDNPDCHLLIAGRNHDIDYTPLSGCRNVTILDEMLSDLDFEAFLEMTSVLLLPYRAISQSGLIFSAINRHVPVLVTDIGGLGEILRQGNIGWNIGEPSVENLQRKMGYLVSHPEEIANVKQQSEEFEKLQKEYSWDTIGVFTSKLYEG